MNCWNCGTANSADARFCSNCGSSLTSCPVCGAAITPGVKFCSNCGTRLAGANGAAAAGAATDDSGAATERPPATGEAREPGATTTGVATARDATVERRMVTVLFVDLVGFTAMSSSRDAESVRELQTRYFDRAREIVVRYGGTIEKFIGDAVMALWGAPTAREDDAERAVRAALDLVEMVPSLGQEAGVDLQLRAGVLTGQAAVGIGAVGQGMVTGDMVNTAARLQSIAPPGAVFVGDETRLAAGQAITFEPAGEHELKGVPVPVRAWRALRVVGERGGARKPEALEPPFVGRGEELRFLKEQFHATGRERRARLVSLVGQAGIGKSRLAWELEKYLDGVVESVAWHRGRSPSYGEGVTFWALSEAFRRRAGLSEGADEETTRSAVSAMVSEYVSDDAERAWIEPRILHLLGIGEAPSGGKAELFAAWRTFFERLAETATVALVIEDLQWTDDGLLDFLEHLLDWGRSSPIFVLTLARPELLERRPGWGTDRRGATAMRLEPLSSEAMQELLEGMAPGLPERAVARILERAEGIPLYAVETIRMLVATGRLVQGPDGLLAPPAAGDRGLDLANLDVPPTLHALVAARLDALPPADRSLLQDAAVLGRSFTIEALAAMTGETPTALESRLASLVRQELLAVETDPRSPSRGQHAFV
ncbi:MAG TPA: adenylate/guanylate cyclase domain-containing protein, partial [Candidatus Deferrimicrobiaceae bacterium]|nr:adenylate/guanylate cyclase domain-containing protein [Candidatus Deferrimicrobiaceae bacterium]